LIQLLKNLLSASGLLAILSRRKILIVLDGLRSEESIAEL
jgi:hypothetical protein